LFFVPKNSLANSPPKKNVAGYVPGWVCDAEYFTNESRIGAKDIYAPGSTYPPDIFSQTIPPTDVSRTISAHIGHADRNGRGRRAEGELSEGRCPGGYMYMGEMSGSRVLIQVIQIALVTFYIRCSASARTCSRQRRFTNVSITVAGGFLLQLQFAGLLHRRERPRFRLQLGG